MAAKLGLIFKIWLDEVPNLANGLVCLGQMSKKKRQRVQTHALPFFRLMKKE